MTLSINLSADDYKERLKQLVPPGKAFPTEDTSNWVKLLDAIAQEMARVDTRANDLLNEAFPDTTTELLPEWERVAGLPDECSELGESYEIRRKNLVSKISSRGGQSINYFISVATSLGFEITITEFDQFRADINAAGDAVYDDDWQFAWQINAPEETVTYFRANLSAAGEALAEWGNDRLECVFEKLKPAHTVIIFTYG